MGNYTHGWLNLWVDNAIKTNSFSDIYYKFCHWSLFPMLHTPVFGTFNSVATEILYPVSYNLSEEKHIQIKTLLLTGQIAPEIMWLLWLSKRVLTF